MLETGLTYSAIMGGLGMFAGLVSGFVKLQSSKKRATLARGTVPRKVQDSEELTDLYITLASHRGAKPKHLEHAFNRCADMFEVHRRVTEAGALSVGLSLITDARAIHTSVMRYLRDFYDASHIPLVQVGSAMVPVNFDLQQAHQNLVGIVDGTMASITNVIQAKHREAVTLRR